MNAARTQADYHRGATPSLHAPVANVNSRESAQARDFSAEHSAACTTRRNVAQLCHARSRISLLEAWSDTRAIDAQSSIVTPLI
jgi:hypothetical protein